MHQSLQIFGLCPFLGVDQGTFLEQTRPYRAILKISRIIQSE
jgi:hypothetical protein